MEENIKDKSEGKKPEPTLRPGGQGFTVTPVSPSPSKPTTPLPKVSTPPPPVSEHVRALERAHYREKKDVTTFFLLLAIIFNIVSLWVLISIGLDKIPGFLIRFF